MIGIVVDSNSQLPHELAERYGIVVVPLTVSLDGVEYREGVDIDADQFYNAWRDGRAPHIDTSQPSPGDFVEAYGRAVDAGATEILSVHISATMSGTMNSARLATSMVSVPVHLVDTGTASFGVSCCAWAAAEAVLAGADIATAVGVAERQAAVIGTAFIVGVPSLMDESGRAVGVNLEVAASDGIPVIGTVDGAFRTLCTVNTVDGAVEAMAGYAGSWSQESSDGLRVAVGTSDSSSVPVSDALTAAVATLPSVIDVVQYRIGPSVGAFTGPGTSGLFVF